MTDRIFGSLDETARPFAWSALDRLAKKLVRERLASIRHGSLRLVEPDWQESFGELEATLRATLYVEDPRFYRALALRGALGGAEAYMDGYWQTHDLTAVVRILALNQALVREWQRGFASWIRPALARFHALHRNTRSGSRRNIAAHYDLGNAFFEHFLDPTLTYSSGIFESADATMEQASIAKYERVCDKLRLGATDHVLEIGSGWGGFALHAASTRGCRVTTTTISREQHARARERIAQVGLTDRVEVLFEDYRELTGEYDRLVSLEMIEAVGSDHLDAFFRVCSKRLKPDGVMLLQAITVPDRDYAAHVRTVDFIKRYIFPGADLVSVLAMSGAAARSTDLRLTHLEDLTPHYAETLRRWRDKLFDNLGALRGLGLDDRFLRMWEFYLCYCEGGFEEREIGVVQAVFEKPRVRRASLLGRLDGCARVEETR
jgi:cyclopropane-fatty-acyl-phospholipid synthase